MQRISNNRITQTKHGKYNAVDYSARPDPYIYAPEDAAVTAIGMSGDCGLRLELKTATKRHSVCHCKETYVKVGQKVRRGQKLAKMGYSGLTIPKGPAGTHAHHVILAAGKYIYPPSLATQKFIKLEEDDLYKGKTAKQHHLEAKAWRARAERAEKALEVCKKQGPTSNDAALKKSWKDKLTKFLGGI